VRAGIDLPQHGPVAPWRGDLEAQLRPMELLAEPAVDR
jgi:hypothetical protein